MACTGVRRPASLTLEAWVGRCLSPSTTCSLQLSPGTSNQETLQLGPGVQRSGACWWLSDDHWVLQDPQNPNGNEICLFLETIVTLTPTQLSVVRKPLPGIPTGPVILFFKLYDPAQRKLSFVGHLQVG